MGIYVNPKTSAFSEIVNDFIYVDKTELLLYTNSVISSPRKYICNSRPRRFGKSVTAEMLTSYYSKGCNSKELFANLNISRDKDFEKHLNKYDVIHFDVQSMKSTSEDVNLIVNKIQNIILDELKEEYTEIDLSNVTTLQRALSVINASTGNKFIIIIDEWDALIRTEINDQKIQEEYINFLRELFKGYEASQYIALAYLTGILPIVKDKTQSALNNFREFTMLSPGALAPFFGFTQEEVKDLCNKYHQDFNSVKHWYDGYQLKDYHVYNPRAVVCLMESGEYQSYWSSTGTYESIKPYIAMNFGGLKESIIEMLSGKSVKVNTRLYQNNMISFESKDEIITMLIHLGYLAYNQQEECAYIPNEEIRYEFIDAVNDNHWNEFIMFQNESRKLLDAILIKDCDTVSQQIEKIHNQYTSNIYYNNENSLSSVLTIALLASMDRYLRPIRELPAGKGFADFVYLPKARYVNEYPVLIVELKWDKSAQTAINQILDKNYPDSILDYCGNILLVGINYDKTSKVHTCCIRELY